MTPENFDWVTALSSCTLSVVFEQLKLDIESDVNTRNAALKEANADYSFKMISNSAGFVVSRITGSSFRRVVQFTIKNSTIEALDESNVKVVAATLTLDDQGGCRFLSRRQRKNVLAIT